MAYALFRNSPQQARYSPESIAQELLEKGAFCMALKKLTTTVKSIADRGAKYKLIEFYLSSKSSMKLMSKQRVPSTFKAEGVCMVLGNGLSRSQ